MNSTTTLAERLVQVRTKRGLTQGALGEQVGMTQQGIGEIEAGNAKGTKQIGSLAHALGVSAYWLETGLGKMDDADGLSDAERMVVTAMRQMTPSQLKGFLAFMSPEKPK